MTERKLKRPEVLAPAGTLEKLKPRFIMARMLFILAGMRMDCVLVRGIFHLKRWKKASLLLINTAQRFM